MDEVSHLSAAGIDFGAPTVNVDQLRGHKEKVIGKLTGGLAAMAKMRKVTIVRGYGAFVGSNQDSGSKRPAKRWASCTKARLAPRRTCNT